MESLFLGQKFFSASLSAYTLPSSPSLFNFFNFKVNLKFVTNLLSITFRHLSLLVVSICYLSAFYHLSLLCHNTASFLSLLARRQLYQSLLSFEMGDKSNCLGLPPFFLTNQPAPTFYLTNSTQSLTISLNLNPTKSQSISLSLNPAKSHSISSQLPSFLKSD